MEQYAIGIDIGTGSTKALAITLQGKVLANQQKFYPTIVSKKGFSEQDPELIFKSFIIVIKDVIKSMGYPPFVVGLSSCMHSLVCVDSRQEPVSPLITWADNRAAAIAEQFRNSGLAKKIYRTSGAPVHSMLPLCKIIWLKQNDPDTFDKTVKFISIKEFIWYKLFKVYEADQSIASATGLFNTSKKQWDKKLLELCHISPAKLSDIVATNTLRTYNGQNKKIRLSNNIVFCIGASDGCLANLGVNALQTSIAALTIGTSGAVRVGSPQPVYNNKTMLFNYVLDDTTFITGGPLNNGGNVIQWLLKTFLRIYKPSGDDYRKLFRQISSVPPGCNGLVFLPYLNGERCPVWDEKASGIFIGIREHHLLPHFLRAGIEGVCYALKNILEVLEKYAGISQVNVTGGFINSPEWLQILTDILNKRVCVIPGQDASAKGAAIVAFKATGKLKGNSLPLEKYKFLEPGKNAAEVYDKQYLIYKNLYKTNMKYMHSLHI